MRGKSGQSQGTGAHRCPACGAENYAFAPFCILCGEPFDEQLYLPHRGGDDATTFLPSPSAIEPVSPDQSQPTMEVSPHSLGLRFSRREAVIGILILVLALGFVIYDWQRATAQADAYRAGIAAEQKKDWDQAAAFFEQAGDHRDAGSKAQKARVQLAERNRLYVAGSLAADGSDWKGAVAAFEQVEAIQPAFADTESRLVQARGKSLKVELGGLIYLVGSGPNPGLYLLDSEGQPSRLPGTDAQSSLRAVSPDGSRFVYDRPKQYADSTASTAPNQKGQTPDSAPKASPLDAVGRVAVLATRSNGTFTTRSLVAISGEGTGVFSDAGLWWYSGWYSEGWNTGYDQHELLYLDTHTDNPPAVQISTPFTRLRPLALDTLRSRLVLAESAGELRDAGRTTRIYLADAKGENKRLVGSMPGDVQTASVSGDGHWLLATTNAAPAAGITERAVWLLSLDEGSNRAGDITTKSPLQIESLLWQGSGESMRLSAAFLPSSASPARVIVDRADHDLERLTFYSTEDRAVTHIWYTLSDTTALHDVAGFSHSGLFLSLRRKYGPDNRLELVGLAKPDFLQSWNVLVPSEADLPARVAFASDDAHVVIASEKANAPHGGHDYTLYSAGVDPVKGLVGLQSIGIANTQSIASLPPYALSMGGNVLAYVTPLHELHAVFLNGKQDSLLVSGASAVWSLADPSALSWER